MIKICEDLVELKTPDGPVHLPNNFVFALIGYRPDLEFLEANGIQLEASTQRPRTNPDTLESERDGVYLAGVIVAGMHTNESLHREWPFSRNQDRRRHRVPYWIVRSSKRVWPELKRFPA